jgi:hypothetical protein
MPPNAAAEVAVAAFAELVGLEVELAELELLAAGLVEVVLVLLELLELLQPAASRMLATAALVATIPLVARKVIPPMPPGPVGRGEPCPSWLDKFMVAKDIERRMA